MLIKVIYHDDRHDMVKPFLLDDLIDKRKVKMFHRAGGWAIIGVSPVRKRNGKFSGKEKRENEGGNGAAAAGRDRRPDASQAKPNCWDAKKCGRAPGGMNVPEFGVCPASTEWKLDGIHGGKNAGRACWVVAGTMCHGKPQGTFAQKSKNCGKCDFYRSVRKGEEDIVPTHFLLDMCESEELVTIDVS